MWYSKVKQGGIISGHDYSSTRRQTIQRAVNTSSLKTRIYNYILEDCNVWWGVKN